MQMDLGGFSLTGPREANEDNYFFQDLSSVGPFPHGIKAYIMVSDGMGGYQGGDVASSLAVDAAVDYLKRLVQHMQDNVVEIDPLVAMAEIVQNAHSDIMYEAHERGGASMGATYVGAFLSPNHAWIGHVGDSRAYLIRGGRAIQITEDHSQVGRMLSRGVITEEEAQNHPNRNRIERALGFPNYEIEFDEVDLMPGDALLLCSDGVYTVVNAAVIAEIVDEVGSAQGAAEEIVHEAIACDTDDNSTVVVAKGFMGSPGDTDPNLPIVTAGINEPDPVAQRRRVVRTLTEFDAVEPVRDDGPIPEGASSSRRRPEVQRARRQISAYDAYASNRQATNRRASDGRVQSRRTANDYRLENGQPRSQSTARKYRSSSVSQGQAGRTRKFDPQLKERSSYTRRSAVQKGVQSIGRRRYSSRRSRFNWRTALVIAVFIVAVALIALLVFNSTANVKSVDEPVNVENVQEASGDGTQVALEDQQVSQAGDSDGGEPGSNGEYGSNSGDQTDDAEQSTDESEDKLVNE